MTPLEVESAECAARSRPDLRTATRTKKSTCVEDFGIARIDSYVVDVLIPRQGVTPGLAPIGRDPDSPELARSAPLRPHAARYSRDGSEDRWQAVRAFSPAGSGILFPVVGVSVEQ